MKRWAAALLAIALPGCGESRSASFQTYQEAKDSGLIEKGWIPPQLPRDAKDIRIHWNLDTNISEGTYRSKTVIAPVDASACRPLKQKSNPVRCQSFDFRTEGGLNYFSNRDRSPTEL